jgi:hypothetical protein
MSKPTTEIALTGSDIAVTLEFEHVNPAEQSVKTQVAKVGDITIYIDPAASARKQEALETAALIDLPIDSPSAQQLVINSVASLKAYDNGVEKSRKWAKQPFWDAGVAIDAKAKEEVVEVRAEIARLEKALGAYQKQLDDQAAAARRAQEEADRKRQAAIDAQLAEEQRLREEADSAARKAQEAAASATTALQKARAENERLQAELKQRQADDIANERRAQAAAADFQPAAPGATLVPQPKPAGMAVKREYEIEVTDIEALYRAYGRRFVKMELDLPALKYHLGGEGVDPHKIPGIKCTPVTRTNVRAARNQ